MSRDRALSAARRRWRRSTGVGMASLGLYRPGTGPLHRLPALVKVLGLAGLGVAVVVASGPLASLDLFGLAALALALARPPLRTTVRGLAPLVVLAVLAAGYQVWHGDPGRAIEVATDLLTLVLAATAVTVSTRMEDLLAVLVQAARPLRRWLPAEALALAVALMLRTVPALGSVLAETRAASRVSASTLPSAGTVRSISATANASASAGSHRRSGRAACTRTASRSSIRVDTVTAVAARTRVSRSVATSIARPGSPCHTW